jgi:two-component system, NarL family, sensor kinase
MNLYHTTTHIPSSHEQHHEAHTRLYWRWIVLVISGLALALGVGFVWLHLASPSDGARLEPGQRTWIPGGVVVSPLERHPGGLEPGDVIVAIDGRSMEAWKEGLFALNAPHSQWQFDQTITYTVQRDGHLLNVPVTLGKYPWRELIQEDWSLLLYLLVFALVGTYVFLRRPTDRATKVLFLSTSTLLAANVVWSLGLQVSDITGGLGFWLSTMMALVVNPVSWVAFLHFVLLFPRLHPVLRGRRWIIPFLYILPFLWILVYLVVAHAMAPETLDWIEPWSPGSGAIILVVMALIVLVLWSNFRARLDAVAHQQIRWIVFAGLVSGTSDLMLWILPASVLEHPIISLNVLGLLLLPIPLALAVAILRYRVFDIDRLINQAMVYGTLTAILALIYFGLVIGIQALVRLFTEQVSQSPVVIVASTLAIAALFQPLRRRLQRVIDHRFYRRKYDAAKIIEAFSTTLRNEVDLDHLREELVAVVQETMQPSHVSLWLRPTPQDGKRTPWRANPLSSSHTDE